MVSDSELAERLRLFLSASDLNTTTTSIVRRKLEEDFGVDLSGKKAFIREQIDIYLESLKEQETEEKQGEEEAEEDGDDVKLKAEESDGAEGEEDDEDESEEEEDESEGASDGKATAKRGSRKKNKEVKRHGGGFTKLCSLSPQLQKFTGVPELARTEVVKQIWSYIRENNLQDPNDRRNVMCDDILQELFGVKCINMFQMNKALAKHIWPLESDGATVNDGPKENKRKPVGEAEPNNSKKKEKRQKGGNSGILAPLRLSEPLAKFLGTGEKMLPRSDVVKRMWEYIKQNNLQDPTDKRRVICDEKLKELLDVDCFNGFSVSKLLTGHLSKTED